MSWRNGGRWTLGLLAIFVAILLYAISILCSPAREPLLMVGVLILLPVGIYLTSESKPRKEPDDGPLQVRLAGPGEPGTPKRDCWAQVQMQRACTLRKVVLAVLLASIGLFVQNHLIGTIGCGLTIACFGSKSGSEIPSGATGTEGAQAKKWRESTAPDSTASSWILKWETQADRWAERMRSAAGIYETRPGDTLALVALAHRTSAGTIGKDNHGSITIDLKATEIVPPVEGLAVGKTTLAAAMQRTNKTIEELAEQFSNAELMAGQQLVVPAEPPYDPRQWVDWWLWALVGIAAYLLTEIARNVRDVVNGTADFIGETSWYWTQLAVGPLVAFVILLLFTHIDIDLLTGEDATLEVNLNRYPVDLLIVPAFLLGFYSRVARKLLDQIMRAIFRSAWRAANDGFEVVIKGQEGDDFVDKEVVLETRPPVAVGWSTTDGTIGPGGVFKPPVPGENPRQIHITAVPIGAGRPVTKTVTVVKHKFNVVAEGQDPKAVRRGQPLTLKVEPPPPSEEKERIIWRVVDPPGLKLDNLRPGLTVQFPLPNSLKPGQKVKIQATYAGLDRPIELTVAGIDITATKDGVSLKPGDKVAAGDKIVFRAEDNLAPEKMAKIKWKAEPADALDLPSSTGQEVTGTVKPSSGTIKITAQPPANTEAEETFELTVIPG